jgi:hypothetical protein
LTTRSLACFLKMAVDEAVQSSIITSRGGSSFGPSQSARFEV